MTQNTAKNWKAERSWLTRISKRLKKLITDEGCTAEWSKEVSDIIELINQRIVKLSEPTPND
jgi:hypothetical protein